MIIVITLVAILLSVATKNTWTKGITSGFASISCTFPEQKQKVTSMIKPKTPLMATVHTIARGMPRAASFVSSDMCAAESGPRKANTGESIPTRHETTWLPQFPPSAKLVNTSLLVCRGARTQSGTRIAKKPQTCRIRIMPSTKGSFFAKYVLKMMAKVLVAMALDL